MILPEILAGAIEQAETQQDIKGFAGLHAVPKAEPILTTVNNVDVIGVLGTILKNPSLMDCLFENVTAIGDIQTAFDDALQSDSAAIVLRFDSPGGSVSGVPELATHIFNARQT